MAVGNVKGGIGKTTLAVNLTICEALRGCDVLLVDGDEQGAARAFTQLRADEFATPGYTAVSLRGPAIRTQVRHPRSKYQRIIIDVGGRDTSSLRAALTFADILVVPEKFIRAPSGTEAKDEGRFIQTPIRFPPSLLARIDWAAKKTGLNRSSWIRYAATKDWT